MEFDLSLLGDLAIPHFILAGAITYLATEQPGKFSTGEIIALALAWLIPIIGPISAGLFVLINRRRRANSESD